MTLSNLTRSDLANYSKARLTRIVLNRWPNIVEAAKLSRVVQYRNGKPIGSPHDRALAALPSSTINILGSSHKVELGADVGVLSAVAYLAPAHELFGEDDKRTTCPNATEACILVCLGKYSGQMIFSSGERSRVWKTALRFGAPEIFRALVICELRALSRKAHKLGVIPAARLDGSSDLGDGQRLARELAKSESEELRRVVFWDYTKSIARVRRAQREALANYSLAFSFSGENFSGVAEAIALGAPIAVVFDTAKGEELPAFFAGLPVVNGDAHDAIWLDRSTLGAPSSGAYARGLRLKTAYNRDEAKKTAGSFCVRAEELADSRASNAARVSPAELGISEAQWARLPKADGMREVSYRTRRGGPIQTMLIPS